MNCTPYPWCTFGPLHNFRWGTPLGWLISISLFVFWGWTLIDILTKETDEKGQRVLWAIAVLLTYVIGAVLYHVVRRTERIKTLGH
uniref:Cardiolipin synthase N-terminal domain-containing protein n=1 Tax=candidate division WOR-3 bacterium TaxID=2052148 RepID=A0A7C3ELS0_UNCW3